MKRAFCRTQHSRGCKLVKGGCLVALALCVATASSQDQPAGAEQQATSIFRELDVTEDGYLSGKEAAAVARFDINGDRRVTLDEWRQGIENERELARQSPEKAFAALDSNEDERLTGNELITVRDLDQDRDGRISKAEFVQRFREVTPTAPKSAVANPQAQPLRPATAWDRKLANQFDSGKRWAVVIGVNQYAEQPLQFCVPDARYLADALVARCGYDRSRVLLLTDDQKDVRHHPKKIHLQEYVSETLKKVETNDTVLIFFAGHGFSSGGQSFLCPLDHDGSRSRLTGWRLDELRTLLHDCKAAQKILVLDCCHSGGAISLGGAGPSSEELGAAFEHAQGLLTLASCRTNETSLESPEKGHGLFSYSLVRGLQGAADFDTNGIVDSDEIYRHVLSEVPVAADSLQKGHKQTPIRIIGQDVVGVFSLARPDGALPLPDMQQTTETKQVEAGNRIVNSIGMKLVCLPQGLFPMGSPTDEYLRNPDERLHPVILSNQILMGMYEVTQAEYERVMGRNPSYFSNEGDGAAAVESRDTKRFPVEQVSWHEANDFCRRLSSLAAEKAAGRTYRLPTEAEWEYACRGGSLNAFHSGDLIDATWANIRGDRPYWNARKTAYLGRPCTVGSYAPNGFGLYDMHGNVAEWCHDWYRAEASGYFTSNLIVKTPQDTLTLLEEFLESDLAKAAFAKDPIGPKQGDGRVIRGGSYTGDVGFCRSAARRYQAPDYRYRTNGFRVVCTLSPKS